MYFREVLTGCLPDDLLTTDHAAMPTEKLTPSFIKRAAHVVDRAKPGADRTIYWDEKLQGFGLMVTTGGHKSYVVQYRANGVSRRFTIKSTVSLKAAMKQAKAVIGQVAKGGDPVAEKREAEAETRAAISGTLEAVAKDFLKREGGKLRSKGERERILKKYLYPTLGARQLDGIKRSEIIKLLDRIADDHGPVMADHVLAMLRRVMSWHAVRDDDFKSPIIKGMARTSIKERARSRTLDDDELRAVWRAAEALATPYARLLQFILMTATRLREAAHMKWAEVNAGGVEWTIPKERHKSKKDFLCPLSTAAQGALAKTPRIGRKGWVFTNDGEHAVGGFSKFKKAFDKLVLAELQKHGPKADLPRWTVHDLRRTARSLMSRAGVPPRHAEMALGHVVPGVEGTYDRHSYFDEKRAAFEALAARVERILNPQANVVALRDAR
jgi:integrase